MMKRHLTGLFLFSALAVGSSVYAVRSFSQANELSGDIGKDLGQMSQNGQIAVFKHCAGLHGPVPKLLRECRDNPGEQETALTAEADGTKIEGGIAGAFAALSLFTVLAGVRRMRRDTRRAYESTHPKMSPGQ